MLKIMTEETMTPSQRYYQLHREEKISRDLARYHSRPDVIAKKEERERIRKEKGLFTKTSAEKEATRAEKERIRQEKLATALATKRKKNPQMEILPV